MKKIIIIVLIALLATVSAFVIYGVIKDASISDLDIDIPVKKGAIGSFSAVTPENDVTLRQIPVFKWTAADNADSYTLEIASTDAFELTDEYYIVERGIIGTEFHITAELKKNQQYYWRVTAKNGDSTALIDGDCLAFYYEATLYDKIDVSIGYADEWKVHEVGSKATVTLDRDNFFGTHQESLRVSFDSEDTQRGEKYVESNGWVVVTRSLEMEFYGVDAFYFNFYYAGNDATAYFRLIDEDNEYWYAPIKLAVNSKQTIIIRKDDFVLRTKGTPVMNEKFDFNYLKSMELVFERVDGDGVAYFGDLQAIKYDDYRSMFIDGIDFTQFDETFMTSEGVYFNFEETVDKDNNAMTFSFTTNDGVPNDKKGYGFVKVRLGKILASGDALSLKVDLSGISGKDFNFLIRLIEEDKDIWTFKIPVSEIPDDGNLLIPFSAFVLAEGGFNGDGIKQFYYLKEIQFGVNSCYKAGAITVEKVTLESLAKKVEGIYTTTVSENGVIEDFDSYEKGMDVYYKWETSTVNKDEAIEIVSVPSLGVGNKGASFGYKTDLPEAQYRTNFESVSGYTAIVLNAKDDTQGGSTRRATMTVYLFGDTDEIYSWTPKSKIAKSWKTYTIPISAFKLTDDGFGPSRITCDRITGIAVAFSYSYSGEPEYKSGNHVYLDSIAFSDATEASITDVEVLGKIKMSETNSKIAMIDDFDSENPYVIWEIKQNSIDSLSFATNSAMTASDETASGEGKSLKLDYKAPAKAPYYAEFLVDSSVSAQGMTLLIKGDARHPYAEIILDVDSTVYWYKKLEIEEGWNYYTIKFSDFLLKSDESKSFSASNVKNITGLGIYLTGDDPNYIPSSIYVDEVYFDNSNGLTTGSRAA